MNIHPALDSRNSKHPPHPTSGALGSLNSTLRADLSRCFHVDQRPSNPIRRIFTSIVELPPGTSFTNDGKRILPSAMVTSDPVPGPEIEL
jgi:hypothetical protein